MFNKVSIRWYLSLIEARQQVHYTHTEKDKSWYTNSFNKDPTKFPSWTTPGLRFAGVHLKILDRTEKRDPRETVGVRKILFLFTHLSFLLTNVSCHCKPTRIPRKECFYSLGGWCPTNPPTDEPRGLPTPSLPTTPSRSPPLTGTLITCRVDLGQEGNLDGNRTNT